ncbi:glycoside hydrolase family 88/105 protein [Pseudoduganella lutea]|uniref:Glycoside hydrolase family 88 protein n=1 Tax=Pseudoduganella lutea TaxID=321985 RepID=A0A4P6KXG7_9BURK|nr:glycoside hydrolase family 88 protein [Pseudoduganella lutea]QBE63544.1 glycoside hydrolase family 88 protein [Pseudoduganella lutea]
MTTNPLRLCAALLLAFPMVAVPAGTALAAAPAPASHTAQPAPEATQAAVIEIMQRAADWQLGHPSAHPPTDWTQGAGYAGMMALAGISDDPRYREAMRRMGEQNGWKLGPYRYFADDHIVGQTYAELYLQFRDPAMIAPMRAQFDGILAEPREGSLRFDAPGALQRWVWCDALFMAPPTWARLTAATGDPRYLELAIAHWWRTADFLYDPEERLFFRDSTYFAKREPNGRKVFWSRGNGWVMGGLVRMMQYIPPAHPARPRFERQFKDMAQRLLALQHADGTWRTSLLDPDSYPLKETSGTALTTYALAWGVNEGLLERSVFAPAVKRAWAGLTASVQADGKLTDVQPAGQDPRAFDPQGTEVFGVGAFLLAGSEVYRMAPGKAKPL